MGEEDIIEFVKLFGSPYDYERDPNKWLEIIGPYPFMMIEDIANIQQKIWGSDFPKIVVGILSSTKMNAVATRGESGTYHIGLNIGSVLALFDLYFKMLALNHVLKNVGHPEMEQHTELILYDGICPYLGVDYKGYNLAEVVRPMDRERVKHASRCLNVALMFFWLHEFGHVMHGHCDYRRTNPEEFSLYEFGIDSEEASINFEARRTLEVDADSFATNQLIAMARHLLEKGTEEQKSYFGLENGLSSFSELLAFTIYSMFRLFGFRELDSIQEQGNTHPAPNIRIGMVLNNISAIYQDQGLDEQDELIRCVLTGVKEAEYAFSAVSGMPMNFGFVKNFFINGDGLRPLREFQQTWRVLYPELVKYSVKGLPKPQ